MVVVFVPVLATSILATFILATSIMFLLERQDVASYLVEQDQDRQEAPG